MEPSNKRKCSNSKKHVLKKLHSGWHCKLFQIQKERTESQPKDNRGNTLLAVAILIATGLRPTELELGVILRITENGSVEIEIQGAKVREDKHGENERGIDTRWIVINPQYSEASRFLANEIPRRLSSEGASEISFSYSKSTLKKVINNLGKKYLEMYQPKLQDLQISPYCLRHLMSASLKSCNQLDDVQRAQVLGHLSILSMQSYAKGFRTKTPIKPALNVRTTQIPGLRDEQPAMKFAKMRMKSTPSATLVAKPSSPKCPSF
jgi:integrase